MGDHQVGCSGNGDHIDKHTCNGLRDIIFAAVQSAALAPLKKFPELIPGFASCPADVFLPYWCRGCPVALDITIISTMQEHTVTGAAITKGHALRSGEEQKRAAHNADCQAVGVTLVPMVVETMGGWREEAVYTIKQIIRILGHCSGSSPAETTRYFSSKTIHLPWRANENM